MFALLLLSVWCVPLVIAAPADSGSKVSKSSEKDFGKAYTYFTRLRERDPRVTNLSDWEAAASGLLECVNSAPSGPYAAKGLFALAELYHQTYREKRFGAGLSRAVFFYERLIKDFPGNTLADDALLALGDLRRDALGDEAGARAAYYEIIDRYSKGDKVREARKRIDGSDAKLANAAVMGETLADRAGAKQRKAAEKGSKVTKGTAEGAAEQHGEDIAVLPRPNAATSNAPAQSASPQLLSTIGLDDAPIRDRTGLLGGSKQVFEKSLPRRPLVVIDPGHGGDDLGAVGIAGLLEKDVTLNIALMLDELLRDRLRAETQLTRSRDTPILLEDRTKLANERKADLFISIHANASELKNASGIETYYLDNTDDKASLKLAERENSAPGGAAESDLNLIVSDLIQNAKLDDSIALAHFAQDNLVSTLSRYYRDVRSLGVKRAPFYVLVGAHMPCVLVEVAFIDHPLDGARLSDQRYQRLIATGLYKGIRAFFESTLTAKHGKG